MWKFIRNSKFYQINTEGEIRCIGGTLIRKDNKPYTVKPTKMKPYKTKCGYLLIELKCDLQIKESVHRLVLETFCPIENMEDYQVNHIDGNKTNNNLNNLEWVTRSENMQHAMAMNLFRPDERYGERHPMCKLTYDEVNQIKDLINNKIYTQHEIALIYNVSDTTISEIKSGKTRRKG